MSAPNLKEIEWAISELENQESSEGRYTLLAALYTCRNQMLGISPAVHDLQRIQQVIDDHQHLRRVLPRRSHKKFAVAILP